MNPLTVGSLFSGIGGIDLGLERAGFQVIWQVENDPFCTKVLRKHWPDVARFRDIRDCGRDTLARVDLIAGGFPCQPHSLAGERQASQDERNLWPEFYRLICELRPAWVLCENVLGLLSSEGGHFFAGILRDLAKAGYDAEWTVLQAADVGAPHRRERVFIVAYTLDTRRSNSWHIGTGQIHGWQESRWEQGADRSGRSSEEQEMEHSHGQRCEEFDPSTRGSESRLAARRFDPSVTTGVPESRICRVLDGLPQKLDQYRGDSRGMDRDSVILGALSDMAIEVDFDTGYIYSQRIRGKEGQRTRIQGANCNGYIVHNISYQGTKRQTRAHRIVWMAAYGTIPDGLMIDHINRDKTDNRLTNLRLVDAKGNAMNRENQEGENNSSAKLTEEQVAEIRILKQQGQTVRQIATQYDISKSQVHNIVTGESWKTSGDSPYGYRWPVGRGSRQHAWEPPRVTDEQQPHSNARLKALGNSVVPQLAEWIGRRIIATME